MNNLKGLFVFSIVNMIERFGFYLLMSVLVLSFVENGYSMDVAGSYYSGFYFSIYVAMLFMGLLGDFTNRRIVTSIGMVLMVIGYFLFSFMSKEKDSSIFIAGACIVLGVGAFKTNLMVQLGDLYKNNVRFGVIAYMVFFAFINLGALIAPVISVFIKDLYGIDRVFLLSGIVTIIALILYHFVPVSTEEEDSSKQIEMNDANDILDVTSPIKNSVNEKFGMDKILGLVFLIFLVPFFWIAFHQNGLVFTFYLKDFVEMNTHTVEEVQTINPKVYFFFSIIAIIYFYFLIKIKNIYSIFPFIGLGMIIVALGYYIPAYGLINISEKLPYSYGLFPIIVMTLGEVLISPFLVLGFYHFSPRKVKGLFLGLYLLISGVGNMLLFLYVNDYKAYGAEYTFNKIVIHILISAAAVFIFWFIIKKITFKKQ